MLRFGRYKISAIAILLEKPLNNQVLTHHRHQTRLVISSYKMSSDNSSDYDFNSMKVVELQKYLSENGLPKDGRKKVLKDRAQKYWDRVMKLKSDSSDTEDKNDQAKKEVNELPAVSVQAVEPVAETAAAAADISKPCDELESQDMKEENVKMKEVADPQPITGLKRQKTQESKFSYKKPKLSAQDKTPLQILNERVQGIKPELISSSGTQNSPIYVMRFVINGQDFIGEGSSKKFAKQAAALKALQFMEPLSFWEPPPVPFPPLPNLDFTSDDPMWDIGRERFSEIPPQVEHYDQPTFQPPVNVTPYSAPSTEDSLSTYLENTKRLPTKRVSSCHENKHPVSLLNELIPEMQYVDEGMNSQGSFTVRAVINNVEFKGEGRNKKQAKVALAVKAVKELFNITYKAEAYQTPVIGDQIKIQENQDVGNIPELVKDLISMKFQELTDNYNSPFAKQKVLAGIVMTRDRGVEEKSGEVICVATGTKCVSGEHLSNKGSSLYDCHAEIVCRRALRRFLYLQLLLLAKSPTESIFECCNESTDATVGYRLKSNVFFHLYISTSPCGDSRIFSPHETEEQNDKHPNRKTRGLLRTKIEAGEGTIPVVDDNHLIHDGVQPWDSVLGGERLLTMSCSDKLARWNLLGLQGSLLSLFVEPIYLSSIILGSLYHNEHFVRGVYSRVRDALSAYSETHDGNTKESDVQSLVKEPYRLNKPMLASVIVPEQRKLNKAPSFCFHWTIGDDDPTIINTVTGKKDNSQSSNLSKMEMFKLFHCVASLNTIVPNTTLPDDVISLSYAQVKELAKEYQELKSKLHLGFKAAKLGVWVKKPSEVDEFYL